MTFNQTIKNQPKEKVKLLTKNQYYSVAAVFVFILSLLVFIFFTPNHYPYKGPIEFEIKAGTSFSQVIDSLYVRRIIPSRVNMKIAAFLYGADKKIKAGIYSIPNGLSYLQLIEIFVDGQTEEQVKITIQEGIWQTKLAKIFDEELNIDAGEIMKLSADRKFINKLGLFGVNNLEGYLLPNTYFFYKKSSAANVLTKLKIEMDKLFDEKAESQMAKLGMSKNAILTLASIIDGESNRFDEFKRIAGVYYNRLKKGIKLQADPTIQYLKRDGKRFNKILYRDLEIDSPYNTYLYAGLPPSPINNPGKEAVLAALYPEENDYLYFVADGTGGHTYSKTYDEHQNKVYNYRLWRSSKDTL